MITLTEFLLARLDEDERAARVAGALQLDPEEGWGAEGAHAVTPHIGVIHENEARQHIVRHNPARVLAEIEVKRTMIHHLNAIDQDATWPIQARNLAQYTLKLLALPHAVHVDYRQEWKP